VALCWILSMLSQSDFRIGHHTGTAYSKVDE
jgi:hypothetical protein